MKDVKTVLTCDVCGETAGVRSYVFNRVMRDAHGNSERIDSTIELCPECQDRLFAVLLQNKDRARAVIESHRAAPSEPRVDVTVM